MLQNFYDNIVFLFGHLRWQDLCDMILVWAVVYRILLLIRKSGTVQVLSGLGILAIFYVLSIWFEFFTFNWLLEKFFSNLFVIAVVLFQVEIRRALAHIGSNPFYTPLTMAQESHLIEEVLKACAYLVYKKHGALIVFERDINFDFFLEQGTELDSLISNELICSIFDPASPLHDGAVIIRSGRILAAGCFLPLSKNLNIDKDLGTRHRAALGLSEESDAVVVIVSEERQSYGLAVGAQIQINLDAHDLRNRLHHELQMKGRVEKDEVST